MTAAYASSAPVCVARAQAAPSGFFAAAGAAFAAQPGAALAARTAATTSLAHESTASNTGNATASSSISSCAALLLAALRAVRALSPGTAAKRAGLCAVPANPDALPAALQAAYATLAQDNYPYAAQLQAAPVVAACAAARATAVAGGDGMAVALAAARITFSAAVPPNASTTATKSTSTTAPDTTVVATAVPNTAALLTTTSTAACWNVTDDPLDYTPGFLPGAWTAQRCTEVLLPTGATAQTPPFLPCAEFAPNCVNATRFSRYCQSHVGAVPRATLDTLSYPQTAAAWAGGAATGGAERIVFTNGDSDPWSYAGVPAQESVSVPSWWMRAAAHHLDLRAPNPADPPDVAPVREKVEATLRGWLAEME